MPAFKSKEVVSILRKLGFIQKRQSGSHLIMYHPNKHLMVPVPIHAKDIKRGLLQGIAKQAESSEQEFLKLK